MYPDVGRAGTPGAELIPELRDLNLETWRRPGPGCRIPGSGIREEIPVKASGAASWAFESVLKCLEGIHALLEGLI